MHLKITHWHTVVALLNITRSLLLKQPFQNVVLAMEVLVCVTTTPPASVRYSQVLQ